MNRDKSQTIEIDIARPDLWIESRSLPVEVSGFDTRDVSESGCRFQLRAEVEKNSAVSIRVIRRNNGLMLGDPPVLFRIVWVKHTCAGWMVAAAKLQHSRLRGVAFPVEPDNDNSPEDSPDTTFGEPPAA
ncbi:MAG: hypothetical protein ACRD4R_08790 [Candidatus Acidiferrales bacterium]